MPGTTHKVHRKRLRAKLRAKMGRHYIVSNYDDASPFVQGMARVVDVGGLLRTTNVGAARKVQCRHLKALKQPNHNAVTTHRVMGEVGAYFQRVIGQPIRGVAPAEDRNGKSLR